MEFDAKKLQDMIDGFAETLMKHLAGEIETLMSLDGFGMGEEVMKIHEEYEVQVRKNIDAVSVSHCAHIISPTTTFITYFHRPKLPP